MYSERIILNNYSKGSFGHVFKDTQSNVYKITKISENGLLTASNINELIILNFLKVIKKIYSNEPKEQCENDEYKKNIVTNSTTNDEEITINSINDNTGNYTDYDINSDNKNTDETNNDYINDNKIDKVAILHFTLDKLINFDKVNFKMFIKENIFMQSISTNYYDFVKMAKSFAFSDGTIATKYFNYLNNSVDKILLVNKMVNYELNLTKFIETYHVYTVNNFDSIAKKLLKTLALLHHNGFLHGDLKSGNILINDSDNLCITDFGAIKITNFDKYHLSCTISSRCPEDLEYEYDRSKSYFNTNAKSDIWSLGLIFTEMILGFNPILKLYQQIEKTKVDSHTLEKKILMYYKSIDYINILQLVKINSIKNHLSTKHYNQIIVIENMLKIDPQERLSNIEEVYEKLFEEKFTFNFKIDYDYEYAKFNINNNFQILFNLRKENYIRIFTVCEQLNILYVCPLIIDILDRLFIKILDKINNNLIDLRISESNLLFSAVILLASGIINQSHPPYSQLLMLFKLKNDLVNVANVNNNLLEILKLLEFDIYRPFNIFYCHSLIEIKKCKCTFLTELNENIFVIHDTEHKKKLLSLLYEIIDNDIIGISPEYYYQKLSS